MKTGNKDTLGTSTRGGKSKFGKQESKTSKSDTKKRLTAHQWGELLGLLRAGDHTQKQLSEMYNVSVTAIAKKRAEQGGIGIGEGSVAKTSLVNKTADKTSQAIADAMSFESDESRRLMTETRRRTFRRHEQVGKIGERFIAQSLKDGKLESAKDAIKVLMDWQMLIDREMVGIGKALGFREGEYDLSDDLPELTIRKMTAEDIAYEQQRLDADFFVNVQDPTEEDAVDVNEVV